jgi:hypothetical protein
MTSPRKAWFQLLLEDAGPGTRSIGLTVQHPLPEQGLAQFCPKVIESRCWTDEADPVDNRSGPIVLEHVL